MKFCELCGRNTEELYRCVECFNDGEQSDMCDSCRKDHIGANIQWIQFKKL